jgi:hypothetical protein
MRCTPITKGYFVYSCLINRDTFSLIKADTSLNVIFARNIKLNFSPTNGFSSYGVVTVGSYFSLDHNIAEATDSSIYLYGSENITQTGKIIKFDKNGNYQWALRLDSIYPFTLQLTPCANGGMYGVYTKRTDGSTVLVKWDASFNILWGKTINLPFALVHKEILEQPSGNLLLFSGVQDTLYHGIRQNGFCQQSGWGTDSGYLSKSQCLVSLDGSSGNVNWSRKINIGFKGQSKSITACHNGDILLGGTYQDTGGTNCNSYNTIGVNFKPYLIRVDASGQTIWSKNKKVTHNQYPNYYYHEEGNSLNSVAELGNGDILIGECGSDYHPHVLFDVLSADASLGVGWRNILPSINAPIPLGTVPCVVGVVTDSSVFNGNAGLNPEIYGNNRTQPQLYYNLYYNGIDTVLSSNYICADTICGYVWSDDNANGIWDPSELPIANDMVLNGDYTPLVSQTLTDSNGYYKIPLLHGLTSHVRAILPPGFTTTNGTGAVYLTRITGACNVNFGLHRSGNIRGSLFYDLNRDSIQDYNETGIDNFEINSNIGRTVITTAGGNYNIVMPADTSYRIFPLLTGAYSAATIYPAQPATVSVVAGQYATQNFAVHFAQPTTDYGVSFNGTNMGGFGTTRTFDLSAVLTNFFRADTSGVIVTLKYDSALTYTSSTSTPVPGIINTSNHTITWNLRTPMYSYLMSTYTFAAGFTFDGSVTHLFKNTISLSYTNGSIVDINPYNNHDSISIRYDPPVVNSNPRPFDPNFKEAITNSAYSALHYLPAYTRDTDLVYTIHFQNTGHAPAVTVVILDTLSTVLDARTFRLLASSHTCTPTITNGVINFLFPQIMLPDSNANEPGSHGWVSYSIKPKNGLAPYTGVTNQAHIYFDAEAPVATDWCNVLLIDTSCHVILTYDTSICNNALSINGQVIHEAGTYFDTVRNSQCDTINVYHVSDNVSYHLTIAHFCGGSPYITGMGDTLYRPGNYYYTITCDSGINLLLIDDSRRDTTYQSICAHDSVSFGGVWLYTAGVYTNRLQTVHGCDSVRVLSLTDDPTYADTTYQSICAHDSVLFGGVWRYTAGVYSNRLQTIHGCDSVRVLSLTVDPTYADTTYQTICAHDSVSFGGVWLYTAGVYTNRLQTVHGCDSVRVLNLTVYPTYTDTTNQSICASDSILFGGVWHHSAGIYTDTLQTVSGCDSILALRLAIRYPRVDTIDYMTCLGSYYVFYTDTIRVPGVYALRTCDSAIQLTFHFDPSFNYSFYDTICQGEFSVFYSDTLFTAGTYIDTIPMNRPDCLSIQTLYLSVKICTDIKTIDAGTIRLYPNPNSGTFTIETEQASNSDYRIYDGIGSVVAEGIITSIRQSIALPDRAAGVYLLAIKNRAYTKQIQFVIEK